MYIHVFIYLFIYLFIVFISKTPAHASPVEGGEREQTEEEEQEKLRKEREFDEYKDGEREIQFHFKKILTTF